MASQEQQTVFAVDCLRWLRHQHAQRREQGAAAAPWRVVLVGHSMGGIVARAALAALAAEPGFGACCMPLQRVLRFLAAD